MLKCSLSKIVSIAVRPGCRVGLSCVPSCLEIWGLRPSSGATSRPAHCSQGSHLEELVTGFSGPSPQGVIWPGQQWTAATWSQSSGSALSSAMTSYRLECPQSQAALQPQGARGVDVYPSQARVAMGDGQWAGAGGVQAGPSPGLLDHGSEL